MERLRAALKRLERSLPPDDGCPRGPDGMRLIRIVIPPLPPGARAMTEADREWLRSRGHRFHHIPDDDERVASWDGSETASSDC